MVIRKRWLLRVLTALVGCGSEGPALPAWLLEADTTSGPATAIEDITDSLDTTGSMDSPTSEPMAECGNGRAEHDEECDGTDGRDATCESLGQAPGTLRCTESCTFDVSGCVPPGMVLVPTGAFEMGSDEEWDELPIRQVYLDAFWIDETEVTVEEYLACPICDEPDMGATCNWGLVERLDHPVNCVDWYQARTYCEWADEGTKRLPTEAEWEKAARGTDDARAYPWGNTPEPSCSRTIMDDTSYIIPGCGYGRTWRVGSKPLGASPYGAQDMAGNVWEWVADRYGSTYDSEDTDNPTGPMNGTDRSIRGGSWASNNLGQFRASNRNPLHPKDRFSNAGFRCAKTPPESP